MERTMSTMRRAVATGIVVLCFYAVAQQFSHATPSVATEPSRDLMRWEYAELEFVGILPDAYSSYSDYRDALWQWSCAADGVLVGRDYVTGIKDIHKALTGYPLGSSIRDRQRLAVLLHDVCDLPYGWWAREPLIEGRLIHRS